jgi:hypothetical protein
MERSTLYEKFTTLSWQQQLGNLAVTLAKISERASEPRLDTLTALLLREAALLSEWCAKNVPPEYHPELAHIQKECLEWKKSFPQDFTRNLLSINTRYQSDRLLQISGFIDTEPNYPIPTPEFKKETRLRSDKPNH